MIRILEKYYHFPENKASAGQNLLMQTWQIVGGFCILKGWKIVDNSMATDKQQHKSFLAFIWSQGEYMLFRNQVDNEVFGYGRTIISRLSWSSKSICNVTELQWWFGACGCLCVCVSKKRKRVSNYLRFKMPKMIRLCLDLVLRCSLRSINKHSF